MPRNAGFVTNALTLSKIVWPSGAEWAASAVGTGAIADQPSQFHILTSLSTRPLAWTVAKRPQQPIWQLAERLERRLHRDDISIRPQAADHGIRRSGNLGMSVELISRVNVRNMDLDDRSLERLQRVDKRD